MSEINLFDEKTMKFITDFLTKVTVTVNKETNTFTVNWDTQEFHYMMDMDKREQIMSWLLWVWFMTTKKENETEEKTKRSSYVS